MSYAALTTSNLASQSWNNIYTMINEITDPELGNRPSGATRWVFSAYPENEKTWPNWPLIVIETGDIPNMINTPSKREYRLGFEIMIFHNSKANLDTLTDSVLSKLVTKSLRDYKMYIPRILGTIPNTLTIDNQRIHTRTITVEYTAIL